MELVEWYLDRGWPQVRIAKAFGLTRGRISQLVSEINGRSGKGGRPLPLPLPPPPDEPQARGGGSTDNRGRLDPESAIRAMWVGPGARVPKALHGIVRDLAGFPPSQAVRMLRKSDLGAVETRLTDVIEASETALSDLQAARAREGFRVVDVPEDEDETTDDGEEDR